MFSFQDRNQDRNKEGEKKKKESIFDLSKYIDKQIRVKFQGGREGRPKSQFLPFDLAIEKKVKLTFT